MASKFESTVNIIPDFFRFRLCISLTKNKGVYLLPEFFTVPVFPSKDLRKKLPILCCTFVCVLQKPQGHNTVKKLLVKYFVKQNDLFSVLR